MSFKTTFAQTATGKPTEDARSAVGNIKSGFAGFEPAFIVFFAAVDYDPGTLAAEMRDAFPGATTMGCSANGEACDEKILDASVVAMAFSKDAFAFSETALILADKDAAIKASRPDVFSDNTAALEYLGRNLGKPLLELDHREYVGFMLADSANAFLDSVIDRSGEMTNVFFTGGIASDRFTFDKQTVFYNGEAYRQGAVVLALWKPKNGFALLKTQAVELMDTVFTATEVDEEKRIIWKFNGKDALEAYSEAIGVPKEKIGQTEFDNYALAVMADNEPYLCAPIAQVDGKGLLMYSRIVEGMRLTATRSGKLLETTEKALADTIAESGEPSAILHVNCVCRHKVMCSTGLSEKFGAMFARCPHVSYMSMGEVYVNWVGFTSVMILFK
jgi:hypothetical protein